MCEKLKITIMFTCIICIFLLTIVILKPDDTVGDNDFNYGKDSQQLINYVIQNNYLKSVNEIIDTPSFMKPVYNIIYGKDENNENKIVVLYIPKPKAEIEVIEVMYYKNIFSKDKVYKTLKDKGFDLSNIEHDIHLKSDDTKERTLIWCVNFTYFNIDKNKDFFYQLVFDFETGEILNE